MTDAHDDAIEYIPPENTYQEPVATLLTLGDVRDQPRYDYRSLGLSDEHVPELARLAVDPALYWGDSESDEVWAPIHAWRALADLRAESALDALVSVLSLPSANEDLEAMDRYDDWIGEELPEVFATIGPVALSPLSTYLRDTSNQRWARATAAEAMERIAERFPETRDEVIAVLAEVVDATTRHPGPTTDDDEVINGWLISSLLKFHAVESAPVIERAFAAERVDLTINGDWEDAQIDLGLRTERETPARNYIRERLFGDTPPEVLDRLFNTLGASDPPGFGGHGAAWSDPGFDAYYDDGPPPPGALTPAQIKQREAEAKRKAKNKRKMAQQSRKQNRKKKK